MGAPSTQLLINFSACLACVTDFSAAPRLPRWDFQKKFLAKVAANFWQDSLTHEERRCTTTRGIRVIYKSFHLTLYRKQGGENQKRRNSEKGETRLPAFIQSHYIATKPAAYSSIAALAHLGERQTEVSLRFLRSSERLASSEASALCGIWRYCVRSTEAALIFVLLPVVRAFGVEDGSANIDVVARNLMRASNALFCQNSVFSSIWSLNSFLAMVDMRVLGMPLIHGKL
ncbi:uncharacterized protein BKA78DRAFT_23417 [Phyllosticta capitalensis]|uniref:uncharacterized protein n=1 Tax=Phyllosticta capitalensis TaxID=121624 RepID=UPI0031326B18